MRMPIELSPFHRADLTLAGFLLHNRWPENMREWGQFMVLAVRIAAVPGLVRTSEVFASDDDGPPLASDTNVVGVVADAGPVIGEESPAPGSLHRPHAMLVLHPPGETIPTLVEDEGMASGCLFLPGIPDLGLTHRATWVEVDSEGNVGRLVSRDDVGRLDDPDVAVLATLVAA
jgi:hypothetical protein